MRSIRSRQHSNGEAKASLDTVQQSAPLRSQQMTSNHNLVLQAPTYTLPLLILSLAGNLCIEAHEANRKNHGITRGRLPRQASLHQRRCP